ncbi:paraquat-inducible protein A [Alteromonas oceanisediminis]|uniref:paraquat-inducible protein A n=1 Tax=Alteromonas oceanisediminis TaxID=2836180 RepID=UPI001BDA05EC|nr:paraquat-inducible protein A [Alteromonas oceanisediminis]MBT0587624.1 paraquat-inducible protein A [Alteromonas oceanisediminis]
MSERTTLTCEHCQTTFSVPVLQHRERALCPRCGNQVMSYRRNSVEFSLGFGLAGLIFLLLSIPFNFLSFRASGQQHSMEIIQGLLTLVDIHYTSLAIVTALATLVLPGSVLLGICVLQYQRLYAQPSYFSARVFVWVQRLLPWSMAEIFLVGTLVSLVKITSHADVLFGMSFFAYVAFTLCSAFTLMYFDRAETTLWLAETYQETHKPLDEQSARFSIQHTWALLLTAVLLYIPANLLPVMHTNLLGRDEPSTIIGGVRLLWQEGSYPIASIIFIASIMVPVAKLIALAYLNYTVQRGDLRYQSARARSYRITELIGRWSMIDVFVVAILVALIQLGNTMSIYPGPGVLAFCAVVFVTMVAAMTFDSRLIWYTRNRHDRTA